MNFDLILTGVIAAASLWRLVTVGQIIFNNDAPAALKKQAWVRGTISALLLIACGLWYSLIYQSPANVAERHQEAGEAICHDVLKAYAATTIAAANEVRGQYRLDFPMIPNPERSKETSNCNFTISAPVDRIDLQSENMNKDRATFTAEVQYLPESEEWVLHNFRWDE